VASDRARITFDPTRDYRSVVAQQGRVTLEADVNEAAWMASEALRLETIDIVGPAGTPDNGYEVSVSSDGTELVVGPGIMYAGGWRFELDKEVELNNQPDWLDQPIPPLPTPTTNAVNVPSLVALLAIEQSVTAVEDQPLREVALGGPDTTARMRLMQHFVQIPTQEDTCAAAAAVLQKQLVTEGLILNPKTLELTIEAALKVSFNPPPAPPDPCCPPAQGGYLGADNQLVRVTVTSYDPATRSGTLLWGWNNASFLYRASLVDPKATPQILTLSPAPIDMEHTPQPGQAIEVLQTSCVLGNPADDNYVASLQGAVMTLSSGSVFSNNQLTLSQPLPTPYSAGTPNDQLFVRLWQAEVPFSEGVAAPLDDVSGLAVTIIMKAAIPAAPFDARPFWHFAVRPNTPQQVYPQRYLEDRQLPDGPRRWLCDLAVVGNSLGPNGAPSLSVLADCRIKFKPLTELDSCTCCNLTLEASEDWQGKLAAAMAQGVQSLSICFQPGEYDVTSKITFTRMSVKIIGAGLGTIIKGATLEAVLEFDNCPSVTLSDFAVEAGGIGYIPSQGLQNLQGAVTLRDCSEIDIERIWLKCASADLRAASCLYVMNTAPAAGTAQSESNIRILNSQFAVGHAQVGILLVNADRAQVEGNLIVTPMDSLKINRDNLADHPEIQASMAKLLVHGMTLVDTQAAAQKAQRKLAKKQARGVKKTSTKASTKAPTSAEAAAPETGSKTAPKPQAEVKPTAVAIRKAAIAKIVTPINLGSIGRARITATFGNITMQFVSDAKLTNAWSNAIRTAGLNESSTIRQFHDAIKGIAQSAVKNAGQAEHAFTDFVNLVLPELYSTASQGIVVGGNVAGEVIIRNNTITGSTQGIHVGLSDRKANPAVSHLQATLVQITGNTIRLQLTPITSGDRHGIFVGGVNSALITGNNISLSRTESARQTITAIKVAGLLGPRVMIRDNFIASFKENYDTGIYTYPAAGGPPTISIWKAEDNCTSASNFLLDFTGVDNNLA
jgi:hypothetical protein